MAVFEYIAKDSTGSKFTGVYTDVESTKDLRQELSKISLNCDFVMLFRGPAKQALD